MDSRSASLAIAVTAGPSTPVRDVTLDAFVFADWWTAEALDQSPDDDVLPIPPGETAEVRFSIAAEGPLGECHLFEGVDAPISVTAELSIDGVSFEASSHTQSVSCGWNEPPKDGCS